jgi:hypothetical protein
MKRGGFARYMTMRLVNFHPLPRSSINFEVKAFQRRAGAKAVVERMRSLNEACHFLPQPLEHAALGEENGV